MKNKIIEFTGTPEAGKTTTINLLKKSLEERGCKVIIISEVMSRPEIKELPFNYNFRTLVISKVVADFIKHASTNEYDYIIIDRGLYDRLFWNDFDILRHNISKIELTKRENFIRYAFDIYKPIALVSLEVGAEESIKRKGKEGSFVTLENMKNYNKSLSKFMKKVEKEVPTLKINTEKLTPFEVNQKILNFL